jgi:hypothetical protein
MMRDTVRIEIHEKGLVQTSFSNSPMKRRMSRTKPQFNPKAAAAEACEGSFGWLKIHDFTILPFSKAGP